MDTEKLFRLLTDLQQDEKSLGVDTKIDAIRANIAQNTPEAFGSAEVQFTELIALIRESSIAYKFSQTESLLLRGIKGESYFGKGFISQFEKIFAARSFELVGKIDEYRNQRNDFIQRSQRLATGFTDMGIEEYRPDSYEVGIILPEEEADLDTLTKRMRDFNLLLSAISETISGNHENIKITRVSNGSLEFFSLQPLDIALLLSTLLLNISAIWDKIAKFRRKMEDTDNDHDLSSEAKKEIRKTLEKETEKIKQEILEELPKKFLKKLEPARGNEIKNQIKMSIKAIFAWIELGIEIDITPVRVNNPDITPDSKEGQKMTTIQEANVKLQDIYKLPKELKQLPFKLLENAEPNEIVSNEEKSKEAKQTKHREKKILVGKKTS